MVAFVHMSFIPVCVVPFTTRMFVPSRFDSEQNAVAPDSSPHAHLEFEAINFSNQRVGRLSM